MIIYKCDKCGITGEKFQTFEFEYDGEIKHAHLCSKCKEKWWDLVRNFFFGAK